MSRRRTLEERRDLAVRDLVELDRQVATGEIDEATAARLRATYEAEAATADRQLAALDSRPAAPDAAEAAARAGAHPGGARTTATTRRSWTRVAGGAAILTAGVAAAVLWLPGAVGDRPAGGFVSGNEAVGGASSGDEAVDGAPGRDLAEVTNAELEQVVADNPDIVPMRVRLAHRYLDDGDVERATDHYLEVLDREDHPEAMAHLGWILFNDGQFDLAESLLQASRARAPDDAETLWFLANLRLYGQQDPAGAVGLLEQLAGRDDLGDQRPQVEQLLREARDSADATDREDAP